MNLKGMFGAAVLAIGSFTAIGCALPAAAEQATEDSAETATSEGASNAIVFFRSWFAPAPVRARAALNFPAVRYTVPAVRYTVPTPYVKVKYAPPAPRYEAIPRAPRPNQVFVRGHWQFNGLKYVWVGGHYETKRMGQVYVSGHWNKVNGHYIYKPGHWRAA